MHTNGSDDDPQSLRMFIDKNGIATISNGPATNAREMQASQDLLVASVDKPMVVAYVSTSGPSLSSGNRDMVASTDGLTILQEGS